MVNVFITSKKDWPPKKMFSPIKFKKFGENVAMKVPILKKRKRSSPRFWINIVPASAWKMILQTISDWPTKFPKSLKLARLQESLPTP